VLEGCSSLTALPEGLARLTDLQVLNLAGCSKVQEVPAAVWQLSDLLELDLSGCSGLTTLPALPQRSSPRPRLSFSSGATSIRVTYEWRPPTTAAGSSAGGGSGDARATPRGCKLQKLTLKGCSSLTWLPEGIAQLTGLQVLNLAGCSS
jgi:hypothetical protein